MCDVWARCVGRAHSQRVERWVMKKEGEGRVISMGGRPTVVGSGRVGQRRARGRRSLVGGVESYPADAAGGARCAQVRQIKRPHEGGRVEGQERTIVR
jgi:hypothetical protein